MREACQQCEISDRMPRPIIPGDRRALNKRVVEALANQCYAMELDSAPGQRMWAYRKAAWAIEDLAGRRVDQPADGPKGAGEHSQRGAAADGGG